MTLHEVVQYFGNLNRAVLALGLKSQNATRWKRQGYVPLLQQYRIAELSDGKLMPQDEDPKLKKTKKEL